MENPRTRVIKKYANRKLYDTHERRYITKEILNDLLEDGFDVQVIDKETGIDITEQTLGQRRVAPPLAETRSNSASELVKQQLVNAIRGGLMLPLEVGQRAVTRWERKSAEIDPEEFADLCDRVEELSYEVAALRAIIAGKRSR